MKMENFKMALESELKKSKVECVYTLESGDEADLASMERVRDISLDLKMRELRYIQSIRESLGRVKRGSFGVCVECKEDIEPARLKANPTAKCCLICQEDQERFKVAC
ncbi:MAG: TraR/DksA family transcriptional regulator [Bacteriovoracaceae bacterium]|nr:TraR/DksA family transcriptional regulator [Bacteriovoracaceae bacterium]